MVPQAAPHNRPKRAYSVVSATPGGAGGSLARALAGPSRRDFRLARRASRNPSLALNATRGGPRLQTPQVPVLYGFMKSWLGVVVVGVSLQLHGQVVIQPFTGNGVLTWYSSYTNATGYGVEWAPTVTGPWSLLTNVSALTGSNSTYSTSIPMFYRVVVNSDCGLPGDCCEFPTVLPGPGTVSGTTLGYSNNVTSGGNCAGVAGPDRFYSIAIPPGKRLYATVATLNTAFDPSISLQANCNSPRSCLSGDDAGSATTVNGVTWDNSAATSLPVLIVVDTYASTSPGGPFDLTVAFGDIPPGETCANATALAGDTVLTGESTAGYLNNTGTSTSCGAKSGLDRYYSANVPAGRLLTVTAVPATGLDISLGIFSGCPATNCLAQADAGAASVTETARYTNSSSAAQMVYIAVDTSSAVGNQYNLTTTITTP